VSNLLVKLGAGRRAELAAVAHRTGLLSHIRPGGNDAFEPVPATTAQVHRPASLSVLPEREWDTAKAKLADTEVRMVAVLDELHLTELACSIEGLSPVGAAAILAETGHLRRFTSSRAVVKHAGLAPRERMSGTFTGRARLTGAGRPHLRVAAWRAVWGCLQNNRVYAARYRHLTTRVETNKLKPTQAQTVIAGAILRQLHAVITTGEAWDPDIATRGTRIVTTPLPGVAA
jgi:transposase